MGTIKEMILSNASFDALRLMAPINYTRLAHSLLFGLVMALQILPLAWSATDTALAAAQQQLPVEELRAQKQQQLQSLEGKPLSSSSLELASLEYETARVTLSSLELELRNLPEKAAAASQPGAGAQQADATVGRTQSQLDEYRQQLQQTIENQKGRVTILNQWLTSLRDIYSKQQTESSQSAWVEQQANLQKERDGYLERAKQLKSQLAALDGAGDPKNSQSLRISILEADERASLISQRIQIKSAANILSAIHTRLDALDDPHHTVINELRQDLDKVSQELGILEPIIKRKMELLQMYQGSSGLLNKSQQKQVSDLVADYQSQQDELGTTLEVVGSTQARLMDLKSIADKQLLSSRYSWPDSLTDWRTVAGDLQQGIFSLLSQSLAITAEILRKPPSLLVRTLLLILVSMGLLGVIRSAMTARLPDLNRSESSYSRWMSALYMHMVRRNLYTLFVLLTVPVAMWMLDIPFDRYRPMYWILTVVMVTKPLLTLNHTLFTQRKIGLEWYDRHLYRGLHVSIFLAAALIILELLSRYSSVSSITSETISRLVMLAVLVGSAVVLWRRTSILQVLSTALEDRPKIFLLVKVTTLLFPLAGLLTGFIGLLGYTNIAWLLARYEGVLLGVVTGWMIVRGFVIDFFKSWYGRSTRKMPNGWILAQALIRPLELLVRSLLILFAAGIAFRLLGWSKDASVIGRIREVLNTHLLRVGESDITLSSVLVVLAASGFFFWAAKWSREFAYRWLYRRIHDHGIRNSLSVFTQYAVVMFGLFALLKILGIDLTALAVLAGAIGVGIGFGLQTIANNFISGILLLIERPFRTGDIINIGGNEGEVTRIGIRSLSVKTWDNTEVIIPNTDTMTSAFVNWTHEDHIIRVKDYIGVSYDSDPHRVKQIIEALIDAHPAILKKPEPRVFLDAFADSSVNFRVQFFVDIEKTPHLGVKSELWFNIWDAFKAEGIEIPYPQQDLHLRSVSPDALRDLAAPDSDS